MPIGARRYDRLRTLASAAALGLAGVSAPAQAAALEAAIAPIVLDAVSGCRIARGPLSPAAAASPPLTKSVAVLGGAPSALDAIRAQQAAVAAPAPALLAEAGTAVPVLAPGIDASVPVPADGSCAGLVTSRIDTRPGMLQPITTNGPDDFLASKRIRIARTNFDRDWKRVRGETISTGAMKRYLGALSGSREADLAAVNRWVNQRIRYAEDADQYGKGDFWAGARKTLRSGRGDCEDIALLKMQLLAAAGVSLDDMILTIARDLARNADHAVLIVRTDAGYRLLDNATDEVLDAAPRHDYRAILSFGNQTSWLHGV